MPQSLGCGAPVDLEQCTSLASRFFVSLEMISSHRDTTFNARLFTRHSPSSDPIKREIPISPALFARVSKLPRTRWPCGQIRNTVGRWSQRSPAARTPRSPHSSGSRRPRRAPGVSRIPSTSLFSPLLGEGTPRHPRYDPSPRLCQDGLELLVIRSCSAARPLALWSWSFRRTSEGGLLPGGDAQSSLHGMNRARRPSPHSRGAPPYVVEAAGTEACPARGGRR